MFMQDLGTKIRSLEERNKRVEADKAWETSLSRKLLITFLTYFVIVLFFTSVELPNPFVNAIVPTIGFMLSTLSLPFFKQIWLKYFYKKR